MKQFDNALNTLEILDRKDYQYSRAIRFRSKGTIYYELKQTHVSPLNYDSIGHAMQVLLSNNVYDFASRHVLFVSG